MHKVCPAADPKSLAMPDTCPVPDDSAEGASKAPHCAESTDACAVDWFGMTESNLSSGHEVPPPEEAPEPLGPSLAFIGGLRP
jgi:hypothetical protein